MFSNRQPPTVARVGAAFSAGADLRSGRALDDLRGRGAHLIVQIAEHDEPSFGAAAVEELVGELTKRGASAALLFSARTPRTLPAAPHPAV